MLDTVTAEGGYLHFSVDDGNIIFTHEWVLNDKNVQKFMTWFAEYAYQAGKPFGFPEDNIGQ